MSDLLNIATIVLAGTVQAFLQVNFGTIILLYYSSMGKHRRRKTRYLAKSYIWGVAAISFLMICAACFVAEHYFDGILSELIASILAGTFAASAIVMFFFYYRKKKSTELWLPRNVTSFISKRAKTTNDNVEAFSLGVLNGFTELPLSLALYLVVACSILNLSVDLQILGALIFTLSSVMPPFIVKLQIKNGKNAVEAQKWRLKNLPFLRIASGCSFGILALFLIAFWVF